MSDGGNLISIALERAGNLSFRCIKDTPNAAILLPGKRQPLHQLSGTIVLDVLHNLHLI